MTHASKNARKAAHEVPVLKTGITAMAVGLGLLAASGLLDKSSPLEAAISKALSMPAWWAMGTGAVLIMVHGLLAGRRHAMGRQRRDPLNKRGPTRLETSTLLALIDQAESTFAFEDDETSHLIGNGRAASPMRPVTH